MCDDDDDNDYDDGDDGDEDEDKLIKLNHMLVLSDLLKLNQSKFQMRHSHNHYTSFYQYDRNQLSV